MAKGGTIVRAAVVNEDNGGVRRQRRQRVGEIRGAVAIGDDDGVGHKAAERLKGCSIN